VLDIAGKIALAWGMRKIFFANNQTYHVFNRGTEKRKIFLTKRDYERFLISMAIFNNSDTNRPRLENIDIQHPVLDKKVEKPLVDVLCFCLMPNHYHLMLRQRVENGISRYLHRLQMGYSKYFNLCYERSGNLFQGQYKAVEVKRQNQFQYLPLYIHMNPLELVEPQWEERGVKSVKKAVKFLENYSWSSLKNYVQELPAPYLEVKTLSSLYGAGEWREAIENWSLKNLQHRVLELDK
jgi:putative transposase